MMSPVLVCMYILWLLISTITFIIFCILFYVIIYLMIPILHTYILLIIRNSVYCSISIFFFFVYRFDNVYNFQTLFVSYITLYNHNFCKPW